MMVKHRHRLIAILNLFIFLLFIGSRVEAQSSTNGSSNSTSGDNPKFESPKFNPSMAVIIVVLVSSFFFLGFFTIYIRQCGSNRADDLATAGAAAAALGRLRLPRGLDPEVLERFPTLVYSDVKEHKIGKGALECAICLNEFEDEETIRLLPKCDHVFHQECIDAWLETHVTCPVCRANYSIGSDDFPSRVSELNVDESSTPVPPADAAPDSTTADHVAISVDDVDERKEEMRDLLRIASKVRGNGAKRSRIISRSQSTGHLTMPQGEAGHDRYTLRLPENVRKEIIAAGKLQRARTFAVSVGGTDEASLRKVSRGSFEESSRRGRTIRLGRSDRWPSFFGRSLSTKISMWGKGKKGEEAYFKERSMSRKVSGIKSAMDYVGGGSKSNDDDVSDERSTAALNRV